jgi:hypothetical protein
MRINHLFAAQIYTNSYTNRCSEFRFCYKIFPGKLTGQPIRISIRDNGKLVPKGSQKGFS